MDDDDGFASASDGEKLRDAFSEEFLLKLEDRLKEHHDRLLRLMTAPAPHVRQALRNSSLRTSSTRDRYSAKGPGDLQRLPSKRRGFRPGFRPSYSTYNARASLASFREQNSPWVFMHRGSRQSLGSGESVVTTGVTTVPSENDEWSLSGPGSNEERRGSIVNQRPTTTSYGKNRVSECSTFSQYEDCHRTQSLEVRLSALRTSARSAEGVLRRFIRKHVRSTTFEGFISVVIVSNVLFCGFEVDYLARARLTESPEPFRWVAMFYAIIFALELVLRLLAEGRKFFHPPQRGWNFFDVIVNSLSLLEVFSTLEMWGGRELPSVRMIRMVRVVRVLRIARIMRHFRSLRILIYSVLNTLRSLLWTMLLLCIILYMFGIIFTQATMTHVLNPDNDAIPNLEEFYGTLLLSAFTLFKAISGGHSWDEVALPLLTLHPIWMAFYLLYFAFTYFAVLNVVTGVFCQTAIESANTDAEMAAQAQLTTKQEYISRLEALFQKINPTNGCMTLRDFENSMQDEKLRAYFESIDLSIDEAFSLFKLLDRDGDHIIDIDAFVTGCLKLRGQAKSIDIAMMMYETRWCMQKCMNSVKAIEHCMATDFVAGTIRAQTSDMRAQSSETPASIDTAFSL